MALRANGTNSGESVSQQAAASAVGQHFGFIRRFFERRLGSDPCSEELAQVTAIKCIEAHDRVRARDRFFAYVRAIARNVFFDHLCAKRRADHFDDLCSLEDAAASPADAASKAERNARLADAVELLPRACVMSCNYATGSS